MLPRKHYAAVEIEQVLKKQEDPEASPPYCGAEESTLRRWKREFPAALTALASRLYSLSNTAVSLVSDMQPLQRLYDALESLIHPPPDSSYLAWAFFVSQSHPICLG